jgi:hypothetical protein
LPNGSSDGDARLEEVCHKEVMGVRNLIECPECGTQSVSARKLLVDAKTVGARGQAFSKRLLPPNIGWPLTVVMMLGWAVLFTMVAFSGDRFDLVSVGALLVGAFVPFGLYREHRRWKRAVPVPGTLYGCAQCKYWWTVEEGMDRMPTGGENRGRQTHSR